MDANGLTVMSKDVWIYSIHITGAAPSKVIGLVKLVHLRRSWQYVGPSCSTSQ